VKLSPNRDSFTLSVLVLPCVFLSQLLGSGLSISLELNQNAVLVNVLMAVYVSHRKRDYADILRR